MGPQTRNPRGLQQGERYSAYLTCDDYYCTLAGGAWSFHGADEFNEEYVATQREVEYWEEEMGDIRRTFYTEPDGTGVAIELQRDDGT